MIKPLDKEKAEKLKEHPTFDEKFAWWVKHRQCKLCEYHKTQECDGYICFEWNVFNELNRAEKGDGK